MKKARQKITIAIDGHSSCGKSTLAKQLSKELGYAYVDSGAMYRAVTLFFIRNNINPADEVAVQLALKNISIAFENKNAHNTTFLNGENVEAEIRKMYISDKVSIIASVSAIRRAMVHQQQQIGKKTGIVMDGRDIGTVVFPKAELKLFVTADVDVRSERRYLELKKKGIVTSLEEVCKNLYKRDHIDSNRADSPLRRAEDAVLIDNSNLSREEQLKMVTALARCRIERC